MGEIKDLSMSKALAKVKELADEIKICMFCTYAGYRLASRPMGAQETDEEGNIWFLSDKNSNKNHEIAENPNVDLLFAQSHDRFLSVHGKAEISYNRGKIKELFRPAAKIWFTEGEDDPRLSVIKVSFEEGHYWDIKHNKMIQMAKMAASLVTGKTMDDGIEGNLEK